MLNLRDYFFNSYIGITSGSKVEKFPVAYLTDKRLKHQIKINKSREETVPVQLNYVGNVVKDLAATVLVPLVNTSLPSLHRSILLFDLLD